MSAAAAAGDAKHPPAPAFDFTFDDSVAAFDVPLDTYLASHPEFDLVAIGALLMAPRDGGRPGLLLIQRAAHDSMPSRWEVPGGACDREDATILHGLARELWEETGLRLRRVVGRVTLGAGHAGTLGKGSEEGAVFFTRRNLRVIKYSFLVEVEPPLVVKLDPDEHQRHLWATEDEFRAGRVGDLDITITTPQQTATILEGFRFCKEEDLPCFP